MGNTALVGGAIANNGFAEVEYKSSLTVEKRATGTGAPSNDVFDFTITFSDGKTYDCIPSGSNISLKTDEKKLISNIPQRISVTVTEQAKTNYPAAESTRQATIGEYGTEMLFVNSYTAPSPSPSSTVTPTITPPPTAATPDSGKVCDTGQVWNAAGYCVTETIGISHPNTGDLID